MNKAPDHSPGPRLTTLSHGGGCGCKMPPAILTKLLDNTLFDGFPGARFPQLSASSQGFEDAAVWHCDDNSALVATTDFFTPIVDDPYDFGRIAAANALSDIYAMGAQPLFALNILGMPVDKVSEETIAQVLHGGAATCKDAGIPIAGGHSIRLSEPVYGLMAVGRAAPSAICYNNAAQAGDVLILGKPLGIGVLASAHQRGELDEAGYTELRLWATRLNNVGTDIAAIPGVHAMTDVSGFGLSGHLSEMCKGANLAAHINTRRIPLMEKAVEMAKKGIVPGAVQRNQEAALTIKAPDDTAPSWSALFSDPQTNGGLLVACSTNGQDEVLRLFHTAGFDRAAVIGEFRKGTPSIHLDGGGAGYDAK